MESDMTNDVIESETKASYEFSGGESEIKTSHKPSEGESETKASHKPSGGESETKASHKPSGGESETKASHKPSGGESETKASHKPSGGESETKTSHKLSGGESQDRSEVASSASSWCLETERYIAQKERWPSSGSHILAHYDDSSVVVYQAFKPSIADYAVEHQRFGGSSFSMSRMSWVKTNFMWMMYRCGWAQKVDQERVLAVRITREGFEDILLKAFTGGKQKDLKLGDKDVEVRLQWDPDHGPDGKKLTRRAIQLGLRGKTLQDYTSKYILNIRDITDFVLEQYNILQTEGQHAVTTPRETVYTPRNSKIYEQISLDFCAEQTVVSFGCQ